jgi:hypothetical protein
MSKPTPGPWAAIPDSREDSEGDWYILAPDEEVVTFGLSEPDAALIAAAPYMLAVLTAIVALTDKPLREDWPDAAEFEEAKAVAAQARAAIAKAEGT